MPVGSDHGPDRIIIHTIHIRLNLQVAYLLVSVRLDLHLGRGRIGQQPPQNEAAQQGPEDPSRLTWRHHSTPRQSDSLPAAPLRVGGWNCMVIILPLGIGILT